MVLFCLFGQEQHEHSSKYLLLFSTEERKVWNDMRASKRLARIFHSGWATDLIMRGSAILFSIGRSVIRAAPTQVIHALKPCSSWFSLGRISRLRAQGAKTPTRFQWERGQTSRRSPSLDSWQKSPHIKPLKISITYLSLTAFESFQTAA